MTEIVDNKRASLGGVVLALAMGTWLTAQQDTDISSPGDVLIGTLGVTIVITIVVITYSVWTHRLLAIWCAPILGALVWKLADFRDRLYWTERAKLYPFSELNRGDAFSQILASALLIANEIISGLALLSAVLLMILLPIWIIRRIRQGFPSAARVLLLLLAANCVLLPFAFFSIVLARTNISFSSLWMLFIPIVFGVFLIQLFPIAIGSFWAGKHKLKAGLAVLAFQPFSAQILLYGRGPIFHLLHESTNLTDIAKISLEWTLLALSYLPLLLFLVVIPAGLLLSRSRRYQLGWLVLVPLAVIIALELIPGFALIGTHIEFSASLWMLQFLTVLLLWLPLPLAAVLYDSIGNRVETGLNQQCPEVPIHASAR